MPACTGPDIHISKQKSQGKSSRHTIIVFSSELVGPWQHLPAKERAVALSLCLALILAVKVMFATSCLLLPEKLLGLHSLVSDMRRVSVTFTALVVL